MDKKIIGVIVGIALGFITFWVVSLLCFFVTRGAMSGLGAMAIGAIASIGAFVVTLRKFGGDS